MQGIPKAEIIISISLVSCKACALWHLASPQLEMYRYTPGLTCGARSLFRVCRE